MRRLTWELYYPDYEENRALFKTDPTAAMSVMLKPPSAQVWRKFFMGVAHHPKLGTLLAEKAAELKNMAAATGIVIQVATLHDDLSELLYLPCVGKFTNFKLDDGTVVADGPAHWALRDEIEGADLYQDILKALIMRAHLEAGLSRFLASESGPPASDGTASPILDGTAPSAEPAA